MNSIKLKSKYEINLNEIMKFKNSKYFSNYIDILENKGFFCESNKKTLFDKEKSHDITEIKQKLLKSVLYDKVNFIPEIAHKYFSSKVSNKLAELKIAAFKHNLIYDEVLQTYFEQCRNNLRKVNPVIDKSKSLNRLKTLKTSNFSFNNSKENIKNEKNSLKNNIDKNMARTLSLNDKIKTTKPIEIILGITKDYFRNYEKKIPIFKGNFIKTFVINVEKNKYFDCTVEVKKTMSAVEKNNTLRKSYSISASNKGILKHRLEKCKSFAQSMKNDITTLPINLKTITYTKTQNSIFSQRNSVDFSSINKNKIKSINSIYGLNSSSKRESQTKKKTNSFFMTGDLFYK